MAVTSFIPELWSARLIYALDKAHVATNLVNRNYEGMIKSAGDTVHINSISNPSVSTYAAGTTISGSDLTTDDTNSTLVINQSKYFAFKVEDVDKVQSAGNLVDMAMERAAYALNDAADAFLLTTIAAGVSNTNHITATNGVQITANNVYEKIVAMRLKLDKANVPTAGRAIAVSPEVYALLLQDSRFTSVGAQSEEVVRNGLVGKVAGFTVYETNNLPTATVGTNSCTKLIACVPDATTYAEQILSVEAQRMESRFADQIRGLHVYGAKVTDGNQICVLDSYV